MKLQKLLLLAGLLLASRLQAMQPLAPGLISTEYSDDSGSESDVEEFPRAVKKYPDQPLILPKKSTSEPAALLFEKEYDKPYIGGVTRAPLKDEPTLEKGILEYADKPRVYPAMPRGLFTPAPSKQEPDTRFYKDIRRAFLTPLGKEAEIEKPVLQGRMPSQLPVQLGRPLVFYDEDIPSSITPLPQPTRETPAAKPAYTPTPQLPVTIVGPSKSEPSPKLTPTWTAPAIKGRSTLPVITEPAQQQTVAQPSPFKTQQAAGIFATLLGRKIQHSEFEVAIANSTDTPYKIIFNNQTLTLEPNQVQTVNLPDLVKVTGSTIVRTRTAQGITTRTATSRTVELQTIMLQRASDKQEFSLNIGRGSNDKKQIVAIISITQGKKVIKTTNVNFNPPAIGQNVYYLMQVNLMGKDLQETTIEIIPTLAQ